MPDMGPTDGATGRDKAWADAARAWWRRKYAVDPLAVWENPPVFVLPSGKVVPGDTIARCNRYKRMGAVKVG